MALPISETLRGAWGNLNTPWDLLTRPIVLAGARCAVCRANRLRVLIIDDAFDLLCAACGRARYRAYIVEGSLVTPLRSAELRGPPPAVLEALRDALEARVLDLPPPAPPNRPRTAWERLCDDEDE